MERSDYECIKRMTIAKSLTDLKSKERRKQKAKDEPRKIKVKETKTKSLKGYL